jgi:beta-lactam-binding protein with PASTA domain/predicted Ser/Thr protein kinase
VSARLEGTLVDDRYKVVGRLGTGGMAEVFLAEDQQLGRKLALKLLHPRFAEDPGFVERFRREAQAAAGLQHPNVVGVYDRGAWDDTYYIAMEYVPGRTLKQVISEEAPLEPIRAIHLVEEILKAVRFAHRRGVIHRDLKPHNVIVDESDHAKVTDFGIARAGASDMTETGSILGTAQYLSPEQAQGLAVSPSSDLYSVGVILYELLTGRVPFDAEAAVTVAIKHVSEAPVAPRTLNPLIPPALEQVVLWSLNKNPADRPADADEFLAALKHARTAILSGAATERTEAMTAVAAGVSTPVGGDPAALALPASVAERSPTTVVAAGGNGAGAAAYGSPPPSSRSRRDLWLWVGLVALLLAAAIAVAIFLLTAGNQVTVPSVVGKPVKTATTTLTRAGFKVKVAHARSNRPQGVVIRENPAANASVNQGSTIRLTVSAGPGNVTVPQLKDMPLAQAESAIRHARLKVGKIQYVSNTSVAAGAVSSTSPFAGEPEPPGTPINIFVSSGPPKKTVPDVTGDTESAARAALESAGFVVAVSTKTTSAAPSGTVFTQSPAGGTQETSGSTVTIVVAQQPPPPAKLTVPSVTGETAAQAKSQLSAAGFAVNEVQQNVKSKSKDGIVLSQSPGAGTKVSKGATVTLVVGSFQAPTPPPTTPTHTNTHPGGGPARFP